MDDRTLGELTEKDFFAGLIFQGMYQSPDAGLNLDDGLFVR